MSWKVEKAKDGLPVWRGVDAIRDMWHVEAEIAWAFGKIALSALAFALFIGGLAACSPIVDFFARASTFGDKTYYWVSGPPPGGCRSLFSACASEPLLWLLLGVVCLAAGAGCALGFYLWGKPSGWITRRWSLTASAGRLAYRAGPFDRPLNPLQVTRDGSRWSVELDAVARVEAGCTVEWDRVRRYEGKPFDSSNGIAKIPGNEYQTFLFMADGSRRVIYTGNADREGAGMLAHSIGTWIEARRNEAKSKTASPAALVAAGEEGFDL